MLVEERATKYDRTKPTRIKTNDGVYAIGIYLVRDWPKGSVLGSLRRRVAREVKEHLKTNPAIRSARVPLGMKMLRAFYGQRGLLGFLIPYSVLMALIVGAEIIAANLWPRLIPSWSSYESIKPLLGNITSYFLNAQVVMIGLLFPIAVGLITLIVQREESSSTVSDIQVYYSETLAYRIGASSIALSIVLAVQLLWPTQLAILGLGYGTPSEFSKIMLTAVHLMWLFINFSALWHFLRTSLSFTQPAERALLRRRFAASISIPDDISRRLAQALYANAGQLILNQQNKNCIDDYQPSLSFGFDFGQEGEIEVKIPESPEKILINVWIRPLMWAVRSWLNRCEKQGGDFAEELLGPTLMFLPDWRGPIPGGGIICRRNYGVPLTALERFLIRQSFRFEKERS